MSLRQVQHVAQGIERRATGIPDLLVAESVLCRAHPGDLCSALGQSPANMTRVSDALVERKLITRILSGQDRRRMVMRITAKGEALVHECLRRCAALRVMCLKILAPLQQRAY